ncbi:anthranilate synthase, component I [Desulforamulus reducens MI-1]|uniref:Anthranilate synthase component 1 n=1 Tax=Desulforamulus reducens (strain ATCC BAA-1160 / DSM 100696 / MI-1) TaxID=349161 RepID=A4J144_DESRM|nr:anthranilate synthase component I [Desulforamulus reducens]ABO48797.1 anthranilate synthase, component I [Desulforamulus reducens MI-1]
MYNPSFTEYRSLAEEYNLIPVYREYLADTETPVSVYEKLAPMGPSFLLESVEGGITLARYSFIGCQCFLSYRFHQGRAEYRGLAGKVRLHGGPLQALEGVLSRFRTPELSGLPRFTSGAVGYFGYDMIRHLEHLPNKKEDELNLPICQLMFPGVVLAFDHVKRTLLIIANHPLSGSPEESYREAIKKIDRVAERIFQQEKINYSPKSNAQGYPMNQINQFLAEKSSITKEHFEEAVQKAKKHIQAGDIFQVVLSQRFTLPFSGQPLHLYRRLRAINPSPYLYYLDFGDFSLVGASPEMLVRLEGNQVITHPIAGTRPRGKQREEDNLLAEQLLADEKERAEHLMLVDLGRNDLGRVCLPGTVKVSQFMKVERYSHVMHLVSHVEGQMEKANNSLGVLAACFPAGTVTGAPKIRAMQIIDDLEPLARGPYAGAVGYVDFAGNLDTAIIIRTAILREGKAYIQSGAGIVADSDPTKEYEETLHKARAMASAVLAATNEEGERFYAGCTG